MCTGGLNFIIVWHLEHDKGRKETSFTKESVFVTSIYRKYQILEDETINI
jgi:hypothetical protein